MEDVKGRIEIVRMEGGVIDVVIAPRKRYKAGKSVHVQ